jgi:hypothetical protein
MSIKKGLQILKIHGTVIFVKRLIIFLFQNVFIFRRYNFYKKSLEKTQKIDCVANFDGFNLVIVHDQSDVDKLIKDGFDFGSFQDIDDIKSFLNQDAILFCIFFGKIWAHTSWASLKNNSSIDPFFLNMQCQNAGYIGTCSTNPNYRGMGLYPFTLLKICEFFIIKRISTALISTDKNNVASIAGISKAGFFIHSEGYNLNIFGWKVWVVK